MEYIVEKIAQDTLLEGEKIDPDYKIFTVDTFKDINGKDVQIPREIIRCTISHLQIEKDELIKRIQDIDAQITAINNLDIKE